MQNINQNSGNSNSQSYEGHGFLPRSGPLFGTRTTPMPARELRTYFSDICLDLAFESDRDLPIGYHKIPLLISTLREIRSLEAS